MRWSVPLSIFAFCTVGMLFGWSSPSVGDPAPSFELEGSDGDTYSLSQFIGEKPVVIAWFPKAFTGG